MSNVTELVMTIAAFCTAILVGRNLKQLEKHPLDYIARSRARRHCIQALTVSFLATVFCIVLRVLDVRLGHIVGHKPGQILDSRWNVIPGSLVSHGDPEASSIHYTDVFTLHIYRCICFGDHSFGRLMEQSVTTASWFTA